MTRAFSINDRIVNEDDEHCLPATVRMVARLLMNKTMSATEAEQVSAFRAGQPTWPYAALAYLSETLQVVHIDALDAERLVAAPDKVLAEGGFDNDTIAYFNSITSWSDEAAAIQRGLATHSLELECRLPTIDDIVVGLSTGWLPMVALDSAVLNGGSSDDYEGHIVLITEVSKDGFVLQDPGPPSHWDWTVSAEVLLAAMRHPAESAGTVTLLKTR